MWCTHKFSIFSYFCITIITQTNASDSELEVGDRNAPNQPQFDERFFKDHVEALTIAKHNDLVFVLGGPESIKTIMTLLLIDDELEVIKVGEKFDFHVKYGNFRSYPPYIVPEIIPELYPNKESGKEYYVLPDFIDRSKNINHEITAVHLVQRLANSAKSLKFVFTLSYFSISGTVADVRRRAEIRELARNASTFITDIKKYRGSMAVVITQVENTDSSTDSQVVIKAGGALDQAANDFLIENDNPKVPKADKDRNRKAIAFIRALMIQKENVYTRIGVFRLGNETKPVKDMQYLQNERYDILSMVQIDMPYVKVGRNDFHYTVSSEAQEMLETIIEEMKKRLMIDILQTDYTFKDIFTQFEKKNSELNVVYKRMAEAYGEISKVTSSDPKEFVDQLLSAANNLQLDLVAYSLSLDEIVKDVEFIEFMGILVQRNLFDSGTITDGIQNVRTYLEESEKWYKYVISLHNFLSQYSVQKNIDKYQKVTARVVELSTVEENEEKGVIDIELDLFLKDLGSSLPEDIAQLKINSYKLENLKAVLFRTMNDLAISSCSAGKITIRGYNVKSSDVLGMNCDVPFKTIEVFAMNIFFIDADMDYNEREMQLRIIAQTWETIGNRRILMNGWPGKPPQSSVAPGGTDEVIDGQPGIPGTAGGPAGCFLGIGHTFINDQNLEVQLNGGKGGPGQHGGAGRDGKHGVDALIPINSLVAAQDWIQNDFTFFELIKELSCPLFYGIIAMLSLFWVDGKPGSPPGKGGHGGFGGEGGYQGQFFIFGVEREPNFKILNQRGAKGDNGNGGRGGSETYDGTTYGLLYVDLVSPPTVVPLPAVLRFPWHGKLLPKGEDGKKGENGAGGEEAIPTRLIDPAYTINEFKSYIRENLANNIRETNLRNLVNNTEKEMRVQSLYDTAGYLHELSGLENQYLQLRNQLYFIPFHESMVKRIENYIATLLNSDEVTVFRWMLTAIKGKITNLKNFRSHVIIVDLLEYFEIVQINIKKMKEIDREVSISESQQQYEGALSDKIGSALDLINNRVIPELLEIFSGITDNISKLIEFVAEKKDEKSGPLDLGSAVRSFKVTSALNFAGSFAQYFGKVGKVLTKFISAVDKFEKYAPGPFQMVAQALDQAIAPVLDVLKAPLIVYLEQARMINDITKHLPCAKTITDETDKIIDFFQLRIESKEVVNSKEIAPYRKALDSIIEKSPKNCPNISYVAAINKVLKINLTVFTNVKDSEEKVKEYGKQETELEQNMGDWEKRLSGIEDNLQPMFMEIQATVLTILESLDSQSGAELDVTAWDIKSKLGDLKLVFKQMSEGTDFQDDLMRGVEKIDETFALIVKIYDRVQSYQEQTDFAKYLTGIQSPDSTGIQDPALRKWVLDVKKMIQSNVVLDQYEVAVHSFKQHLFPFAQMYLSTHDLPTGLKVNDTDTLVQRAGEEVAYLQEQLKFIAVSIGKFDRDTFGDIGFRDDESSIAKPFYTFKAREYNRLIDRLLRGQEVMVKADIATGINQNAVKFNEIGIAFIVRNGDTPMKMQLAQTQYDKFLEKFSVKMTMVGNNYYRCGEKFYYLPVDDNLVIEYSFKKDPKTGKPAKFNDVYRKLSDHSYFLSPYTSWRIQLMNVNDDFDDNAIKEELKDLRKNYRGLADLDLIGRGQYFRKKGEFASEVCSDEIGKYYDADESLNNVVSTRLSRKFQRFLNNVR